MSVKISDLIRDLEDVASFFDRLSKRKVVYGYRVWKWELPVGIPLKFDVYFNPEVSSLLDALLADCEEKLNFVFRDVSKTINLFRRDDFRIEIRVREKEGRFCLFIQYGDKFILDINDLPDIIAVSRNDMSYAVMKWLRHDLTIVMMKSYPHIHVCVFHRDYVLRKYYVRGGCGLYNDAESFLKLIVNIVTGKVLFSTA